MIPTPATSIPVEIQRRTASMTSRPDPPRSWDPDGNSTAWAAEANRTQEEASGHRSIMPSVILQSVTVRWRFRSAPDAPEEFHRDKRPLRLARGLHKDGRADPESW